MCAFGIDSISKNSRREGKRRGGSEKNRLARKLNWRERRVNTGDEPTVHVQTVGRQINFGQPVDVKTGVDG